MIANIARAEIVTEEETPKTYVFETASDAGLEPFISQGQENELRVKNIILAQNITEDIIKGYNLNLKDVTMIPEVFALVDGGLSQVETDGTFEEYTGPVAGEVTKRTPFTLNIYTEEKDYDGATLNYMKFQFLHCKGSPAKFNLQDGSFFAPE